MTDIQIPSPSELNLLTGNQSGDLSPNGSNDRDIGNIYQNKTGKLLLVVVSVQFNFSTHTLPCEAFLNIGSSNPPTIQAQDTELDEMPTDNDVCVLPMIAVIPDGYFYEIVDNSSSPNTATIVRWFEYSLT